MTTSGPMSSQDLLWLHMDRPTNLMIVDSVLWFDAPVDWELVRSTVSERLVERFPVFRRVPVTDTGRFEAPHWVDHPGFDLDEHLIHVTLPEPGDKAALEAYASARRCEPLPTDRPPWQYHLIDGYGEGSAMVLRTHHAIADGIRLMQVALGLMDDASGGALMPPPAVGRKSGVAAASQAQALSSEVGHLARGAVAGLGHVAGEAVGGTARAVRHPVDTLRQGPRRAADVAELLSADRATLPDLLIGATPKTVWTGQPGIPKTLSWSDPLPLEQVKEVGRVTGTTVNDVLVTLLAEGLHRWLADHGADPGRITVMVPVNLRPLDEALPPDLGNYFALIYLHLPVAHATPHERLMEVRTRLRQLKISHETALTFGLQRAISYAPAEVYTRLVNHFADMAMGILTNVPGPRDPMYLAGHRVAGLTGFAPSNGHQPLTMTIVSYAGAVTIGVAADAGLVPGSREICDVAGDALDRLAAAVGLAA